MRMNNFNLKKLVFSLLVVLSTFGASNYLVRASDQVGPPPIPPSPVLTPSSPCLLEGATPFPAWSELPPEQQNKCPLGYWCPELNATDSSTWPSICPPTLDCQFSRLRMEFCTFQGLYEPLFCPGGYYCPPGGQQLIPCPSSTYCPGGQFEPVDCEPLSVCPEKSTTRRYVGSLIALAIVDGALFCLYWILHFRHQRKIKSLATSLSPQDSALQLSSLASENKDTKMDRSNTIVRNTDLLISGFDRARIEADFPPMQIEFQNLSLRIPIPASKSTQDKKQKTILTDVSGILQPGTVTAIMGPSGCGKTSFLNTLLGKVESSWRTEGNLRVNGRDIQLSNLRSLIGFVPQDDVMYRELSVEENIKFAADMRLPKNWSRSERAAFVESILSSLNLKEIRYSQIGDELSRGVSGGQRKRTSIGMELASAPSALFLDEPTSGLDSTSALEVCDLLKNIARGTKLTVAMVVHQPRQEIWESLDMLLLLAPGGRTIYVGPQFLAEQYFTEHLNVTLHPRSNPADELMDAIDRFGTEYAEIWKHTGAELVAGWSSDRINHDNNNKSSFPRKGSDGKEEFKDVDLNSDKDIRRDVKSSNPPSAMTPISIIVKSTTTSTSNTSRVMARNSTNLRSFSGAATTYIPFRGASFLEQVIYTHNRSVISQYNNLTPLFLETLTLLLTGFILGFAGIGQWQGLLFPPFSSLSPSPRDDIISRTGFYVSLSICTAAGVASVLLWGGNQLLCHWREAASGLSIGGYFLGMAISFIYRCLFCALHFSTLYHIMAEQPTSFGDFFLLILLMIWAFYGLGPIISSIFPASSAVIAVMIIGAIFSLTNGAATPIPTGLDYLTTSYYYTDAMFSSMTKNLFGFIMDVDKSASQFGYSVGRMGFDFGMMAVVGSVYYGIGVSCLYAFNQNKRR